MPEPRRGPARSRWARFLGVWSLILLALALGAGLGLGWGTHALAVMGLPQATTVAPSSNAMTVGSGLLDKTAPQIDLADLGGQHVSLAD